MRHTLILSDLHLWQAIDDEGLWMRYRQRRFFPDGEIAELLRRQCDRIDPGALELVFDGDLFDFDVPAPGASRTPPREPNSAIARLDAILREHRVFVAAVATVLRASHRVVFVSGNHDVQLTLRRVRERLVEHLVGACIEDGAGPDDVAAIRARIVFRAWFHRTSDGIHVEHGNQYDPYCSVRYPMEPFTRGGSNLQPTVGSLAMEHLAGRMGYFNPNVDSSFLLTTREYLQHWLRYYLFTRRSLAGTWAIGSMRVLLQLLLHREPIDDLRESHHAALASGETGVDEDPIREHAKLFALCSLRASLRLLRFDRVLVSAAVVLSIMLALANRLAGFALGLAWVAGAIGFWRFVPRRRLDQVYCDVEDRGRRIAHTHGARAVVFGHTHRAAGRWEHGVFYGNCGTWAPMHRDLHCTEPLETGRPFVWLRSDGGSLEGGLYRFHGGVWWQEDTAPEGRKNAFGAREPAPTMST